MRINLLNLSASQFDQRNFRRALVTDGQNDRADSACDIDLRVFAAVQTVGKFAARQNSSFIVAHFYLSAVRMTAEHQINAEPRRLPHDDRIMRQKDFHFIGK